MKKSAQTATEYMIILAVVIIIALIVLNSLGVIPAIGGRSGESSSSIALGTGKIGIVSSAFSPEGDHVLELRNNQRNEIKILEVNMSITGSGQPINFNTESYILRRG